MNDYPPYAHPNSHPIISTTQKQHQMGIQ